MRTEAQIRRALDLTGWDLRVEVETLGKPSYRAEQGNYITPWRASADMVLCDVRAMMEHGARNEDDPRIQER